MASHTGFRHAGSPRTGSVRPRPRDGRSDAPSPPLTSMVDMMTILVVFLLVNFSVEGDLFTAAPGIRLPESRSRTIARPTLSVEVSREEIRVDGMPVVSLEAAIAGEDLWIAPLGAALESRLGDGGTRLTIQCDRGLEFQVLKRVVHTCSRAGGTELALLVRREDS